MTALLWKISVFSRLRLKCSSRLDLTFFVSLLFYIFYIFASLYFYIFIFLYFFNEMSLSGGDANSTLALFSQQRHFYVFVYFYFCISVYLQMSVSMSGGDAISTLCSHNKGNFMFFFIVVFLYFCISFNEYESEWRRRELNPSLVLTTKGFWGRRRSPTGTFHQSRQWLPHSYFVFLQLNFWICVQIFSYSCIFCET